ncbi:TPA: polysaccharide biosynthesis/export family protein [Photobacterium damselae]|uniref:polysaccharide biosynthesis/export family protein n=1 Tax=Photobacterium damselae TaxID=38293 RepID=UPI003D7E3608
MNKYIFIALLFVLFPLKYSYATDDASLGYKLGPGDHISIEVYGEPSMLMKLQISQGGSINFPYIGNVIITGKTPEEVENDIARRLKGDYILNPMVSVNITNFRNIYVTGEVENPNGYEYQPGLTVEQAIALAGGFTDRADRDDIDLRLSSSKELLDDVSLTQTVHPGDTVIIGQSFF